MSEITKTGYPTDTDGFPAGNFVCALETTRPHFDRPGVSAEASEAVFLVIGAGYTGVSAALRLAELTRQTGASGRIVLVDAGLVGSGPSGKSAGHIAGLQASAPRVRAHCGEAHAARLIAIAEEASDLVRTLIARYQIPCDLRDGYVVIHRDGSQTVSTGGRAFGIDPYPFVLGLAHAARNQGVEVYERTKVTRIDEAANGCTVTTSNGLFRASHVLAAGGHGMARDISLLASLRARTTELRVSMIITDPLPEQVLKAIIPDAGNRRYPFATDVADVSYGSIDRRRRMIFGARATAVMPPNPTKIARALMELFPSLNDKYQAATGAKLGWHPLVTDERLSFTRDLLPNVGRASSHSRVHYIHGLGGHGVALGTILGVAAAEKLWGIRNQNSGLGKDLRRVRRR